jgi:cobalamin transport system permease protein
MSHSMTAARWWKTILLYAIPFAVCVLVLPTIGHKDFSIGRVWQELCSGGQGRAIDVFVKLRLPRVLLALLGGGALAMTGACFQAILRNPLAEPFTLGVTGGASVGAVLAITIATKLDKAVFLLGGIVSPVQFFALVGAAGSVFLIYRLARRPHGISMNILLLAGVTISILCSGVVLFLSHLADALEHKMIFQWMVGSTEAIGYGDLIRMAPFFIPGVVILLWQTLTLNHLSLGEGLAAGHGVDVPRVQRNVFIGGSILTAAVVSVIGPIGFVGLIVPHAVRRLSGYDHRIVLPASFLLGGAFLAVCDAIGQSVLPGRILPVGVVTALIGGPIFIRILLGKSR